MVQFWSVNVTKAPIHNTAQLPCWRWSHTPSRSSFKAQDLYDCVLSCVLVTLLQQFNWLSLALTSAVTNGCFCKLLNLQENALGKLLWVIELRNKPQTKDVLTKPSSVRVNPSSCNLKGVFLILLHLSFAVQSVTLNPFHPGWRRWFSTLLSPISAV